MKKIFAFTGRWLSNRYPKSLEFFARKFVGSGKFRLLTCGVYLEDDGEILLKFSTAEGIMFQAYLSENTLHPKKEVDAIRKQLASLGKPTENV